MRDAWGQPFPDAPRMVVSEDPVIDPTFLPGRSVWRSSHFLNSCSLTLSFRSCAELMSVSHACSLQAEPRPLQPQPELRLVAAVAARPPHQLVTRDSADLGRAAGAGPAAGRTGRFLRQRHEHG